MSVVVITNPMLDHLGHYVCSGNNSLGRDLKTVHLKGRTRKQDLSERCWVTFNIAGLLKEIGLKITVDSLIEHF